MIDSVTPTPTIPNISGGDAGPSSAGLKNTLGLEWGSDFQVIGSGGRAGTAQGGNIYIILGLIAVIGLFTFKG